jgi:hypothetical protein
MVVKFVFVVVLTVEAVLCRRLAGEGDAPFLLGDAAEVAVTSARSGTTST